MPREAHVESYYAATANDAPVYPGLTGEVSADICVVGGGFAGLSVALNLAERGYDAVVLEGRRVGWGASGRNGGQICAGFASGMKKIQGWAGKDDARKLFDMAEEAKAIIRARVARHNIDCELTWGYFHGANQARQLEGLRRTRELWARDFDYGDTRMAETREEVVRYVNSPSYVGGLYEAGAGHLHPLNYCLGLVRAGESGRFELMTRLPHTTFPGGHMMRTPTLALAMLWYRLRDLL